MLHKKWNTFCFTYKVNIKGTHTNLLSVYLPHSPYLWQFPSTSRLPHKRSSIFPLQTSKIHENVGCHQQESMLPYKIIIRTYIPHTRFCSKGILSTKSVFLRTAVYQTRTLPRPHTSNKHNRNNSAAAFPLNCPSPWRNDRAKRSLYVSCESTLIGVVLVGGDKLVEHNKYL